MGVVAVFGTILCRLPLVSDFEGVWALRALPPGERGTLILDLKGCSDVPLNGVSFYGKNDATRRPLLTKIMRQGIKIDKKVMRQGIMLLEIF